MHEKMPEKTKAFIEAKCLEAARRAAGCKDLEKVSIERTKPMGSGSNWQVAGFRPQLPKIAESEALKVIAPLRQQYALPEK